MFRNSFPGIFDENGMGNAPSYGQNRVKSATFQKISEKFQDFLIARTIWQPKTHEIIPKTRGIDQARSLDIARYQEFCSIRSELGDLDLGIFSQICQQLAGEL